MKNEEYFKWKKIYSEKQKKQKQIRKILTLLAAIFLPIFLYGSYLLLTEEWKFIGEKTRIISAKIYQTEKIKLTRASSTQKIYYEYKINNQEYKGTTCRGHDFNSRIEKFEVNDSVVIKISEINPKKHKIIGFKK